MKYVFFLIGMATLFSCTLPGTDKVPVPVLSPEAAIRDFQVETGFEVQVVAAEPLVEDPVAMVFDEDANMWVVEMRGYMNDQEGSTETVPSGRIKILRDQNKDGTYDTATVFLDNLVLPRAIALAYNGLLVIEPPCLYFVENNNGRPGKKTMIDPTFADAGNVEHQPNGLVRNMDNWYYCAKSDKRVRYFNQRWKLKRHSSGDNGEFRQMIQGDCFIMIIVICFMRITCCPIALAIILRRQGLPGNYTAVP
jgi:hypothetical protein